jgi:hypothetical protein
MKLSLDMLQSTIDDGAMVKQIQLFVNVTDTPGQIYIMKDIASRGQAKTK